MVRQRGMAEAAQYYSVLEQAFSVATIRGRLLFEGGSY